MRAIREVLRLVSLCGPDRRGSMEPSAYVVSRGDLLHPNRAERLWQRSGTLADGSATFQPLDADRRVRQQSLARSCCDRLVETCAG
jgi:hypothetical protein